MNQNEYITSAGEITRTEDMMTADQKATTAIREKYAEQEQPPWIPFDEEHIDENFERKPPKPEQIEEMNQRLKELGEVFNDSKLNWHLDGALNISLMQGKYIGYHKDVDISVEGSEIQQLEGQLLKNGYGLFLSSFNNETKARIMKRVAYSDFRESATGHMIIAAINEEGQIQRNKTLNFVDVHIIERNELGEPLGHLGVVIPEKWVRPYPQEFQGEQLNLSHPGKVLYYKLHQGRNYDLTDIRHLIETGKITEEDVDDIEQVYEDEFRATIEKGRHKFESIASQVIPDTSAEDILELFKQAKLFEGKTGEAAESFQILAQEISESENVSADFILNKAMEIFKIEEKNNQKREEIKNIRQLVRDQQSIRRIREELK